MSMKRNSPRTSHAALVSGLLQSFKDLTNVFSLLGFAVSSARVMVNDTNVIKGILGKPLARFANLYILGCVMCKDCLEALT